MNKTNSNPQTQPQDTPIKDRIMIFMGDNLHVVLEDEGDQSVISTERFAQDLANQLNQLITRSKIDELEKLSGKAEWFDATDKKQGIFELLAVNIPHIQERIANLKESLNE